MKSEFIPKVKVEPTRKKRYDRAVKAWQRESPDSCWSDWVRRALDAQAAADLQR